MQVSFTVPAVPVAQPRQRHAMIAGRVRNYTPSKHPVNDFKATVRMAFHQATKGIDWDAHAAFTVSIDAIFPRPKAKTTKKGPNARYRKTSKPDWDNIGKSVCDALNMLAWADDSQIVEALVSKWVAAGIEQPHVRIIIGTIEEAR